MAFHGKHRLGLLVPPRNVTVEEDFSRWMPPGVCLHTHRLYVPPGPRVSFVDVLEAMTAHVEESTRLLARAPIDVVAFACTSGTFLHGLSHDEQVCRRIEHAAGGVRAITTSQSVLGALGVVGARRISVGSPYPAEINERLLAFLTQAGLEVVCFEACPSDGGAIEAIPSGVAYDLGRAIDRPDAEAIFLSCTAWRAAEIIDDLERATGKPVLTSNQALFWSCLRALDVREPVPGGGSLFRDHIASPPRAAGEMAV